MICPECGAKLTQEDYEEMVRLGIDTDYCPDCGAEL